NASSIGAASATVLAGVFGSNDIPFQVDWSRYTPVGGLKSYPGFWAAADEMANARVYGGIHFRFDCVAGQEIGRNVAHYVMDHFLQPRDDNGGDSLMAATAAPAPVSESLRAEQVRPLLAEALARWQAAGIDPSALRGIDVRIADLGGLTLGQAADGILWLDDNAAGWGWFVDATPWEDSEFTTPGDQGELGRMDRLTAVEHEVAHLPGEDHEADGVMQEPWDGGIGRTLGPTTEKDAPTLFAWSADLPWLDGSVSRNGKRR